MPAASACSPIHLSISFFIPFPRAQSVKGNNSGDAPHQLSMNTHCIIRKSSQSGCIALKGVTVSNFQKQNGSHPHGHRTKVRIRGLPSNTLANTNVIAENYTAEGSQATSAWLDSCAKAQR
ncbi:hypothetical protein KIN20_020005 [Parelaphostrongylus tenuis]|uniref:Uncharacterized protein n=1 Tax=Parelaphostrongylus tenuis TaxID=148309 RepID=A0AAD5MLU3_PARTN|nr:hypothetical protein KIN20_020005 [Parelaphostrongylus tenuis]